MSVSPAPQLEMTPLQALDRLEAGLGVTPDDLAGALKVDRRTLKRWTIGETYPQREARRRLVELLALSDRLCEAFEGPDGPREWMHASSRYLGGITPAEALRSGRLDRVEAAFEVLESGIFV